MTLRGRDSQPHTELEVFDAIGGGWDTHLPWPRRANAKTTASREAMHSTNPYQAPAASGGPLSEDAPRLFTPKQIGVAAFLGSAAAGGALLGLNAWRLRKPMHAIGYGLVGVALVTVLMFVVPDSVPNGVMSGVNFGLAFGASALAKPAWESQPPPHRQSNWRVASVSLGAILLLAVAFVGGVLLTEGKKAFVPGDSVDVPGGNVVHWDDVSAREARALAEHLTEVGYFDPDAEAGVVLEREGGAIHMCFFVSEGSWNESETLEYYGDIAAGIDDALFGSETVNASLCNVDHERKAAVYPR